MNEWMKNKNIENARLFIIQKSRYTHIRCPYNFNWIWFVFAVRDKEKNIVTVRKKNVCFYFVLIDWFWIIYPIIGPIDSHYDIEYYSMLDENSKICVPNPRYDAKWTNFGSRYKFGTQYSGDAWNLL